MFTKAGVLNYMQDQVKQIEAKSIEALRYQGEEFVNKARLSGNYDDDTGNLRSSIGYVILKNGRVIDQNFQMAGKGSDRQTGRLEAMEYVTEIASNFPEGLVLIGVAGMNYAAAVESKGYDVITGSAPNSNEIKDLLGAINI